MSNAVIAQPSWGEWRRAQRRQLVVATFISYGALVAVLWWQVNQASGLESWLGPWIGLFALSSIASIAGLLAMRIVSQHIGEGDDALLDERQRQVRDSAHTRAYYTVCFLFTLAIIFSPKALVVLPSAILLFNTLPSAIIAWREPDLA